MKTKKEFSNPVNVIQNKAAIYYVVKGRKIRGHNNAEEDFFETAFLHSDPIVAREQAFSFYQNYVSILDEHKILFQRQLPTAVTYLKNIFGASTLQKYSTATVTYNNPALFDKGVAIYMVVQKPISYRSKTDKKGERFLIYGIWNFEQSDIINLIDGLCREYIYYKNFKYSINGYNEILDLSYYLKPNSKHPIISVPFDWKFNYFLKEKTKVIETSRRLENYKNQIATGRLDNNAFEIRLDKNKLISILASFLNSKGGMLFYGINEFKRPVDVFKKGNPGVFKREMQLLIRQKLPEVNNKIELNFIRVGGCMVAVFSVTPNGKNLVFVENNKTKKLYVRDKSGIKLIKSPEDTFIYLMAKELEHVKTVQEILDNL